ncbi:MAG: hypothetical protein QOG31_1430 [Thermoplasmata archaeon]|jgi:hypothetical protein|nr:hypothetical protein [Thermoplasmata archaeon]
MALVGLIVFLPSVSAETPPLPNPSDIIDHITVAVECQSYGVDICVVSGPCVLKTEGSEPLPLVPVRPESSRFGIGAHVWVPNFSVGSGTWTFNGICAIISCGWSVCLLVGQTEEIVLRQVGTAP